MAGYNIFEDSQEVLEDGHLSIFYRPLPIFDGEIFYNFALSVGFHCDIGSTVWNLRVHFDQPSIDSNVHVTVYIMRTDLTPVRVNALFQMEAYTQGGNVPIIQPQIFEIPDFRTFGTRTGHFSDYIPIFILSLLAGKELVFKFSFSVHGCHNARGRKRKSSNGDTVNCANKVSRPKM